MSRSPSPNPREETREETREQSPPRHRSPSRSPPRDKSPAGENVNEEGLNVYVSNLAFRTTESSLEEAFARHGTVKGCRIVVDPYTKDSRGFGFVEMANSAEADNAIRELDSYDLDGRRLRVEKARRARAHVPTPGQYLGPASVRSRREDDRYRPREQDYRRDDRDRHYDDRDRRDRSYRGRDRSRDRYEPYPRSRDSPRRRSRSPRRDRW